MANGNGEGESHARRHVLGLLVENRTGVLARIASLIAAKGYNIESLSVAATHEPGVSSMTIVVWGDDWVIEQACKQLNRVIDIIKVNDITDDSMVERELVLVKVQSEAQHRAEICRVADIFRANIVDVTPQSFTMELTGGRDKIHAFLELLRPYGIQELARTGLVAMTRGNREGPRPTQVPI